MRILDLKCIDLSGVLFAGLAKNRQTISQFIFHKMYNMTINILVEDFIHIAHISLTVEFKLHYYLLEPLTVSGAFFKTAFPVAFDYI